MKSLMACLRIILIAIFLVGCGNKTGKEVNYVVVEVPEDTAVNDLFEFENVSKVVLGGELSNIDVEGGCYCVGYLKEGNSIVWKSDDDNYGYDDGLFLYIEDKVSDVHVANYAGKLKETPISFNTFQQKYE
ncbi:MAG: hypothetical protein NC293_03945 [Roseburia sp.]|nr:hypothetical protein [Roseburia sp.]